MPETKTRVRKKLFPSTQLLMTTVFLEVATVCLLVLSWAPIGSFETALALFLVANVLGIITASIAFICAIVGLIRFVRHRIANIVLAAVSVLINPVTVVLADALLNSNG